MTSQESERDGVGSSGESYTCSSCGARVWSDNRVWCKCDICGGRIWIDFDHPEAPDDLPRHIVEKDRTGRPGWSV